MITAAQIISLAFNRTIKEGQILESQITAAQFDYIRPALTENFYDYVNQNISAFDVVDANISVSGGITITGKRLMTDLLRPALAYYVKYLSAEDILNDISDRGGFNLQAADASTMSNDSKQNWKATALKTANILCEKLVDYIKKQCENDVAKYALYGNTTSVKTEDKIIGGILIGGISESGDLSAFEDLENMEKETTIRQDLVSGDNTVEHGQGSIYGWTVTFVTVWDGNNLARTELSIIDTDNINVILAGGSISNARIEIKFK